MLAREMCQGKPTDHGKGVGECLGDMGKKTGKVYMATWQVLKTQWVHDFIP